MQQHSVYVVNTFSRYHVDVWFVLCTFVVFFVQVCGEFKGVTAGTMFDTILDGDYRRAWDDHVLEDFEICRLDDNNDIGYYGSESLILLLPHICHAQYDIMIWFRCYSEDFKNSKLNNYYYKSRQSLSYLSCSTCSSRITQCRFLFPHCPTSYVHLVVYCTNF